jgi:hypothetical protein
MSVSLIDIPVEDRLEACLPNQAGCLTSKDFSRGFASSSVYACDRKKWIPQNANNTGRPFTAIEKLLK